MCVGFTKPTLQITVIILIRGNTMKKIKVTIYNVTVNMSVIARRKWLSDEAIQLFHHYRQIKRLDCHALTGSQ